MSDQINIYLSQIMVLWLKSTKSMIFDQAIKAVFALQYNYAESVHYDFSSASKYNDQPEPMTFRSWQARRAQTCYTQIMPNTHR